VRPSCAPRATIAPGSASLDRRLVVMRVLPSERGRSRRSRSGRAAREVARARPRWRPDQAP
jgi:hypothetical protein